MNDSKTSHSLQHKVVGEALRFGVVGAAATALHYLIYYVLMRWMPLNVAYTIGYVTSFFCNFFATSYFTFRTAPSWGKLAGMSGAHVVNYLLHIVLLNAFLWLGIPDKWAPIPVFAIAIPVNFLLLKFVFKKEQTHNKEK